MKHLGILFLLLLISCSDNNSPTLRVTMLDSPVSDYSLTPNLFTAENGTVYMSWLEKVDEQSEFKYSTLEENLWAQPKLISSGSNWFVNWADFPSLIANKGVLSAHWLQKRAEGTYDYDIRISQSLDNGNSWSESFIPHSDGVAAEHGFVSMMPISKGKNFATWLDGRNTKPAHESEDHEHGGAGAMTLRAGVFDNKGEVIHDWELDHRTCDCCQTSTAMTRNGPVVVYRDRSEDEIRDIYITRLIADEWTSPKAVFNDNWEINGCPVNGPSVAAKDNRVVLTWFTAAKGYAEVKMAMSNDAGENFETPVIVSQGKTLGRVGIVMLESGHIALSWLEAENNMADIMLAIFDKNGEEIIRQSIAQTSTERASGFPVMTESGKNIILAWTVSEEGPSMVKSAEIVLIR